MFKSIFKIIKESIFFIPLSLVVSGLYYLILQENKSKELFTPNMSILITVLFYLLIMLGPIILFKKLNNQKINFIKMLTSFVLTSVFLIILMLGIIQLFHLLIILSFKGGFIILFFLMFIALITYFIYCIAVSNNIKMYEAFNVFKHSIITYIFIIIVMFIYFTLVFLQGFIVKGFEIKNLFLYYFISWHINLTIIIILFNIFQAKYRSYLMYIERIREEEKETIKEMKKKD